jgi:hypothetical protein
MNMNKMKKFTIFYRKKEDIENKSLTRLIQRGFRSKMQTVANPEGRILDFLQIFLREWKEGVHGFWTIFPRIDYFVIYYIFLEMF